jgi:hypothetical protein
MVGPQPIDWDQWRRDYDSLDFTAQQDFYRAASAAHPTQIQFDRAQVDRFLTDHRPGTVCELGGHKGELALSMLGGHPEILLWVNHEIAPNLVPHAHERYQHRILTRFPWETSLPGEALILSHVVEHLKLDHFDRLLGRFGGRCVYLDVPVGEGGQDWLGYVGSHVIEEGWDAIHRILGRYSFRTSDQGRIRGYQR